MFKKRYNELDVRLEMVEDIQDTQIEEMEQLQDEVLELKETISVLADAVLQIMREKTTQNLKENFEKFGDVLKAMFSDIGKKCEKTEPKKCKKCDCEEKPKNKTTKKESK